MPFQKVERREANADAHRPLDPVHAQTLEQPSDSLLFEYRLHCGEGQGKRRVGRQINGTSWSTHGFRASVLAKARVSRTHDILPKKLRLRAFSYYLVRAYATEHGTVPFRPLYDMFTCVIRYHFDRLRGVDTPAVYVAVALQVKAIIHLQRKRYIAMHSVFICTFLP